MSDFNEFLKTIAEGKKDAIEKSPAKRALKSLAESLHKDNPFLNSSTQKESKPEKQKLILTEKIEPDIVKKQDSMEIITKLLDQNKTFQQPNPDIVEPNITAIQQKIKFLEQWLGKISAHGPGGGEVNLRYLDDIDRSSISDGRYLKYDNNIKKFVFDEISTGEVLYNTTIVTTSTYTIQDGDYYIGIDYNGPCTITLPVSTTSGRTIIIKDEDGDAQTNPITVIGTVDNDPNGFILKINNGAIQMIYRNGWRII